MLGRAEKTGCDVQKTACRPVLLRRLHRGIPAARGCGPCGHARAPRPRDASWHDVRGHRAHLGPQVVLRPADARRRVPVPAAGGSPPFFACGPSRRLSGPGPRRASPRAALQPPYRRSAGPAAAMDTAGLRERVFGLPADAALLERHHVLRGAGRGRLLRAPALRRARGGRALYAARRLLRRRLGRGLRPAAAPTGGGGGAPRAPAGPGGPAPARGGPQEARAAHGAAQRAADARHRAPQLRHLQRALQRGGRPARRAGEADVAGGEQLDRPADPVGWHQSLLAQSRAGHLRTCHDQHLHDAKW
mmetsp:Transcript_6863/g.20223  ORF Transcript_6863/g.20223 Transcript_6863/m.20223 type:complete len:304 (+) Transcript_6863:242-1153(+)